ncbi:MAG: hypothetical protein R3B40_13255 [Polyangiales bacterium]|nr:hypothetical protein [Myxococcales bacterium]MCB9659927.1 hypothetical protein [Sandaracinaceae bacterium]
MSARPTARCKRCATALALGLLLAATCAFAQALDTRRVGIRWQGGVPRISVSVADLVDQSARRALESGLQKRIIMTVQAYESGASHPFATTRVQCAATYDLWEESYILRIGRRTERHSRVDDVIARCLVARDLSVGRPGDWTNHGRRDLYFAVRAEFNPISAQRCTALLRPSRSEGPIGPIVVNIVRREICAAERSIDFRSQEVTSP